MNVVCIDYRQMICPRTHKMLDDWAFVLRDRWEPGHCLSIEHRYKPERLGIGEEEDRRRERPYVDPHNALLIERVVTAPSFPHFTRQFLKLYYIEFAHESRLCRMLGIRYRDVPFQHYRSVSLTRNRLDILLKSRDYPRHNLTTSARMLYA